MGLSAIGLNLHLNAALAEMSEIVGHDLLVAHIAGIGDDLHVVGRGMIVELLAFFDALRACQQPFQKL